MEQNSMWKYLPNEILEQIMKRLPLREYLAMKAICFPWWISVSNIIEKDDYHHLPELPLALLQSEDSMFYSLSTESLHRSKIRLLDYHQKCVGSVEEWLIVCDYSVQGSATVFFLNPVTNARIMIPSKLFVPPYLYVSKMVASAKPGSDCYLAALMDDSSQIAVYKPFNNYWIILEIIKGWNSYIADVQIIGTKLYVSKGTGSEAKLLVYDLTYISYGRLKAEMCVKFPKPKPLRSRIINNYIMGMEINHCYLAKDAASRELYLIYIKSKVQYTYIGRYFLFELVRPAEVTTVEVFKLDMNKNPFEWQNVKLDGRVAFVSKYSCMVMSRDELNYNNELITENSIYFALSFPFPRNPWLGLRFGKFSLTNNNCNYFPVNMSGCCRSAFPLWFVPSL